MAAGMRPVDPYYDPGSDPALGPASERYAAMNTPMAPGPLPELDGGLPAMEPSSSMLQDWMNAPPYQTGVMERLTTPLPWEERAVDAAFGERPNRRVQGPTLDLSLPTLPGEDPMARYQRNDAMMAGPVGRPTPQSNPKTTRGPMVSAPAKAAVPRGPKTQLALHFARVMGMEAPGEVDSPEELAFAKAAHQAMLKMSKGQSVAKFLSSMNSAKAQALFQQLMTPKPQPTQGSTKLPLNPS